MNGQSPAVGLQSVLNVDYFVTDLETSLGWYEMLLGQTPDRSRLHLATFTVGSATLKLQNVDEFSATASSAGSIAYRTVDVAAAACAALGDIAHRGPTTASTGDRLCQILDPSNNLLALRQPANPSSRQEIAS